MRVSLLSWKSSKVADVVLAKNTIDTPLSQQPLILPRKSRYSILVDIKKLLVETNAGIFILIGLFGFPVFAFGPQVFLSVIEKTDTSEVSVVFLGDIMLDRQVRLNGEKNGYDYIIEQSLPLWGDADAVVANLEGPITGNPSTSVGSVVGSPENFSFTFAPETADFLKRAGITHVSLGNNHILNQGWDGVTETKRHLTLAGVHYFGVPGDNPHRTSVFEKNGIRIALVAYNEFSKNDAPSTVNAIHAAEKIADYTVVFAHWGNEYEPDPREDQQVLARTFVDAGADLIIGAHPHVIQSYEIYNNVPIYYSLGNFIFDQYWTPEVRCGLVLQTTFGRDSLTVKEETVRIERSGQTIPGVCEGRG